MSHNDWIPTLCAIAGEPDIVNKLKAGYTANGNNYKVHLDGYDQSQVPAQCQRHRGQQQRRQERPRQVLLLRRRWPARGMRQGDYKYVFSEQRKQGTMGVWAEPFTTLRLQKIFNLMQDPFERADITSNTFWDWQINHVGNVYGVMDEVFKFVETFKEFPPRSFPPSFNPANIMEKHDGHMKQKKALKERLDLERDSRQLEQDDRAANPAAWDQIADASHPCRPAIAGRCGDYGGAVRGPCLGSTTRKWRGVCPPAPPARRRF